MILIDNSLGSSVTIPIYNEGEELEITLVHHLSGKSIFIPLTPINTTGDSFTEITFPAGTFKYLGLYSFTVKNLLQEVLYIGLAKVREPQTNKPVYTNGIKDYELYK